MALTDGSTNAAGVMLGIGMGGFVDGILLHQIFQVHAMLSAKVPLDSMENMQRNMAADGVFHAVVWLATMIGIVMLWRALTRQPAIARSGRAFAGSMLAGWGVFNLVEGLIDHHILGLHHVVERLGLSVWDWAFLASGAVLIGVGVLMAKAPGAHNARTPLPASKGDGAAGED